MTSGSCSIPPLPQRATRTESDLVFFESAEIRVRVIEQPTFNKSSFDAWDLMAAVIGALQGSNPGEFLACPLGLAANPAELVEDKSTRVIDVLFDASFQFNS